MIFEMFTEKPFEHWCERHRLNVNGWSIRTFRFIKLFFIVIIGEMFFRAPSIRVGWTMFINIFTKVDMAQWWSTLPYMTLDGWDYLTVSLSLVIVIIISVLKEKNYPIRRKFEGMPLFIRCITLDALLFMVILFGAYGPKYDTVAMMYALF